MPHALRHTCAAILIADGWSPKQIQVQLGHASIQVTMDVYGHLFPDEGDTLMHRLDARRRATVERRSPATVTSLSEVRSVR